ncbi:TetR/AcrR family transcriptional regulator [Pseudonocardia sp. S2-4]|uniref:TetR/AcrR family transcriptional regulator n=1 Tax=Pseudonocardia humida TaxID=2800819 RepID=A0ABT0ZWS3_9PSEU|nr:TetR/AcrR family transcriptional regulator [Pseudonocardia humida]
MYPGQVPKTAPPEVRAALVERAATMLARREPVTLRSVVAGTGASTMAVYTHFGGMPGLWRAVRQEGFERLAARLATVAPTDDPVHDVVALGAAYVANAVAHPHLYRAMFDEAADLDDRSVADGGLAALVAAAERARAAGRFAPDCDPEQLALRYWASGHGLTTLVLTGVLPREVLLAQWPRIAKALFVDAGDDPARCARSVDAAWPPHLP